MIAAVTADLKQNYFGHHPAYVMIITFGGLS
jgi:hypothetical protein